MSPDLEDMRRHALAADTRENFAHSERAVRAWERSNRTTLDSVLAWVDSLRELTGESPPNSKPWHDRDFRL